jgi:hypothetical protein
MSKIEKMMNPELETAIMGSLEPKVGQAYDKHMSTGPRKNRGETELDLTAGTLNPLEEMYRAAKLEPQEVITVELVETVRDSFESHIQEHESLGLDLRPVINIAGQMNLGTEKNLVWYHAKQYDTFKNYPAFVSMLSRWTTEEEDHGPLIEMWGNFSGAISSKEAHAIKVALIMGGISVDTESFPALNAFTEPQEFDTGDAHLFLGYVTDTVGRRVMNRVAGHEVRHGTLFSEIGNEMYELEPDLIEYILPIEAEVHRRFGMPAEKSYPDFVGAATRIAVHGLFTTEGVLKRQRERVERLGLLDLQVKSEEAQKAQVLIDKVTDPTSRINHLRIKAVEQETERYIQFEKAQGRIPVILGRTVIFNQGQLEIYPEAA